MKPKRESVLPTNTLAATTLTRPEGERPYVTASEIGNFTYCPEAWFLRRFGHSPEADAIERMHDGTDRHKQIGRTAEQLAGTDAVRRVLLAIVISLTVLLLATSMGVLNLPDPPW